MTSSASESLEESRERGAAPLVRVEGKSTVTIAMCYPPKTITYGVFDCDFDFDFESGVPLRGEMNSGCEYVARTQAPVGR